MQQPRVLSRAPSQAPLFAVQRHSGSRRRLSATPRPRAQAGAAPSTMERQGVSLQDEYNRTMAEAMKWTKDPFTYYPERGLYFHSITPEMLVGSQPQRADDIDILANQVGVSTILNLQEDKDMKYWGVDIRKLQDRAQELDVELVRTPARDFDPHSLRGMLPAAVAALERAKQNGGKVYVHCTAGLGRSPAVAIASLYWFGGMQLDEAYEFLTAIRPCGPKRDAIRGATYDLLRRGSPNYDWHSFEHKPSHAYAFLNDDDRRVIQERVMALVGSR